MDETRVVITKIAASGLVMLLGWIARRRDWMSAQTTTFLARFATDAALPALVFAQMLETVNRETLKTSWIVPLLAAGLILLGHVLGWVTAGFFATPRQRRTFIFDVGVANWIYLPLPIIVSLYGAEGVKELLLCNVGVQVVLWSVSVAILQGGRLAASTLFGLARNIGLVATISGIALAAAGARATLAGGSPVAISYNATIEALRMVGSLTVPLSLLVTGGQLGGIRLTGEIPLRALVGTSLLRLIITPLLFFGIVLVALRFGWPIPHTALMVCVVTAMMPVAVSCSSLAERFGQDASLAAQSVLYTTVASAVTVPTLFWVSRLIFK